MTWILWRMLAWRLLVAFMLTLAGIAFLVFLINLGELGRRAADTGATVALLIKMAALQTPNLMLTILPLVWLFASIWAFVRLCREQAVLIARASGLTPFHILVPGLLVSLTIGLLSVTMLNPVTTSMVKEFRTLASLHLYGRQSSLDVSNTGIWLRQADADGQSVLHARSADRQGATILYDVEMFGFDRDGTLVRQVVADSGELVDKKWLLTNARVRQLSPTLSGNLPEEMTSDAYLWETPLTEQSILDSLKPPESISVWQLPNFIRSLRESGFDARRHQAYLHSLWSLPLVMLAMTLIAACGGLRHPALGQRFQRCMLVCVCGFAFFFMLYVSGTIITKEGPIGLVIWGSTGIGLLTAGGVLLRLEPG